MDLAGGAGVLRLVGRGMGARGPPVVEVVDRVRVVPVGAVLEAAVLLEMVRDGAGASLVEVLAVVGARAVRLGIEGALGAAAVRLLRTAVVLAVGAVGGFGTCFTRLEMVADWGRC